MGIVVTIFMLLALLASIPATSRYIHSIAKIGIAILVLVGGLWNMFYGLQHWQMFWGMAALISGLLMVLSAILILGKECPHYLFTRIYDMIKALSITILIGLLCCFLLYAITLIQLNLGYPIIR